ncbi:hypothetical protein M0R45_001741 [Rubus argutus]|uniref:Uncharacterized protein n=1 Tax=Rubus argutus TaxID=59490 RepID=A0AAW1VG40_RUBAR
MAELGNCRWHGVVLGSLKQWIDAMARIGIDGGVVFFWRRVHGAALNGDADRAAMGSWNWDFNAAVRQWFVMGLWLRQSWVLHGGMAKLMGVVVICSEVEADWLGLQFMVDDGHGDELED